MSLQLWVPVMASLALCSTSASASAIKESTLHMVHVLFRHGDRTNDKAIVYPNDPHINVDYYPTGYGQLTNQGKRRLYALGQSLRKRYDSFLGNIYTPDLLEARSSDSHRTKSSLMLALAGLFPPKEKQIWHPEFNWQPIPFTVVEGKNDAEFFGKLCPNALKLLDKHFESPQYQSYMQKYADLRAYLQKHTGWEIDSMKKISDVYFVLSTEQQLGLKLPDWTKSIYPSPITELAANIYIDNTHSPELIKYAAGFMLKKILNDTKLKINGHLPVERKLCMLSGHDINCAFMLRLLGTFVPHVPPYGSHVIFELHKINDVYGYKIFYEDYSSTAPKIQDIPGCGTFCPIEQFINVHQKYIPDENTKCN